MDREIRMSVSQVFRGEKGERALFIEFIGEDCRAEGKLSYQGISEQRPAPAKAGKLEDFTPSSKRKSAPPKPEDWSHELLSCTGFSEEDKQALTDYLRDNKAAILRLAGGVDAMRAFLDLGGK